MSEPKPYKITVRDPEGDVLSLEMSHIDLGDDDWMGTFKTILYWLGFHPNTIDELFGDDT